MTLYIDGSLVASTATNDASYVAMENLGAAVKIGSRISAADPEYFESWLSDIRLYNVEQSAAWIKAEYNSGADSLISFGSELEPTGAGQGIIFWMNN